MTTGFPRLLAAARRDGLAVARAIARTSAALGDPTAPRDGEVMHIDLARPWCELRAGDEALFGGPVNLLATWTKAGGWRWADGDGTAEVRAALAATGDVPELLLPTMAAPSADHARLVAYWLAVRAGYTGVWIGKRGKATAYYAVDLTGPTALPSGHTPWCTACGRLRRAVAKLIAGPDGVAVCGGCVATLAELRSPPRPAGALPLSPVDESYSPCLRFCQLCGELRGGLTMAGAMGVCRDCVDLCIEIVGGA